MAARWPASGPPCPAGMPGSRPSPQTRGEMNSPASGHCDPGSARRPRPGTGVARWPTAGPADGCSAKPQRVRREERGVMGSDAVACAAWLQRRLGAFVFTVDHPGLPACAGAHRPGQPCDGTRGKHPCGRWSRDSTSDPEVIRAALSRGLRNLGIDCGKSGYLVIDEDRPGAFGTYARSVGQVIPVTFTVSTAKGRHLYFRHPPGAPFGNGTGALSGRGIDVRGSGGYVVGPSSAHQAGVLYAPADATAPVVPAPGWLITALRSV